MPWTDTEPVVTFSSVNLAMKGWLYLMTNGCIKGLALGLFLGFQVSTGTLWLLADTRGAVQEFFSSHLTHFFTVAAAGLALWGVSRQIQSNIDQAEKVRMARLDAARSALPIVLSNMVEMCEARSDAVCKGDKSRPADAHWEITEFELATLKSCIEHSSGIEKELMQEIIRVYQVLLARWNLHDHVDLFKAQVVANDDPKLLLRDKQFYDLTNWNTLKAICNSLFDYSKGELSNPSTDKMKESIFIALQNVSSAGTAGCVGQFLTSNRNYKDFVNRLVKRDKVPFLKDDWKQ